MIFACFPGTDSPARRLRLWLLRGGPSVGKIVLPVAGVGFR